MAVVKFTREGLFGLTRPWLEVENAEFDATLYRFLRALKRSRFESLLNSLAIPAIPSCAIKPLPYGRKASDIVKEVGVTGLNWPEKLESKMSLFLLARASNALAADSHC